MTSVQFREARAKFFTRLIEEGRKPQVDSLVKYNVTLLDFHQYRQNANFQKLTPAQVEKFEAQVRAVNLLFLQNPTKLNQGGYFQPVKGPEVPHFEAPIVANKVMSFRNVHMYMWENYRKNQTGKSMYPSYFGAQGAPIGTSGNVMNVLKAMGYTNVDDDFFPLLQDIDKVYDTIMNLKNKEDGKELSLGYKEQILVGVKKVIAEYDQGKYKAYDNGLLYKKYNNLYEKLKNQKTIEKDEKQKRRYVPFLYPELLRRVKEKIGVSSEQYLYCKMYWEVPTRHEVFNLPLEKPTVGKENYIFKNASGLWSWNFTHYKTGEVFGPNTGIFSAEISSLITTYLDKNKGVKLLFKKPKTIGFVKHMFEDLLKMNKNDVPAGAIPYTFDANMMRHIYATDKYENCDKENTTEVERIACITGVVNQMKHSKNTFDTYVYKVAPQATIRTSARTKNKNLKH